MKRYAVFTRQYHDHERERRESTDQMLTSAYGGVMEQHAGRTVPVFRAESAEALRRSVPISATAQVVEVH
jgi:hypothetical protein